MLCLQPESHRKPAPGRRVHDSIAPRFWRILGLTLALSLFSSHAAALVVRVGLYENNPKIFTDESGKPAGILIDLLREIAGKEGWTLSFKPCAWRSCLEELASGKIDLLPDVAYSEARNQQFDFHQTPALYSWSQVYRRHGVSITSPLDLNHKRIALLGGGIQEQGFEAMANGYGLQVKVVPATSLDEAFRLAQEGKADAAVSNRRFGELHASAYQLVETPVIFQPTQLYYATAHGRNAELLTAIEHYLAAWEKDPASPYYKILKHWGGHQQPAFIPPYVWRVLLAVTGLMLVFLLGTLILRKQVRHKTRLLQEKTEHLQATMDALPDLMFELDLSGRFHDYQANRSELLALPKEQFIGKTLAEVMPPDVASIGMQALRAADLAGWSGGQQYSLDLPQGKCWFELSVARKRTDSAREPHFIVLVHDITAIKLAETKVQRMTRLYAALSQCNQAIVRCANVEELFPQICRDAVSFGGMQMAWIGMLDPASGLVKPVASSGSGTEYLDGITISADGNHPSGQGPTGIAVREDHPVWCQDFANDPSTAPWHERGGKFGWAASASVPLHQKGKLVGVMTLYAGEVNAFDEAEQNLLVEMAMDISFALDRFHDEAQRTEMENLLRQLSLAVEQSPSSIMITNLNAEIIYTNINFTKQTGYTAEEALGRNPKMLQSGKTPLQTYKDLWAHLIRGKTWRGELVNQRKDGSEFIESAMISPVRDSNGRVMSYLAVKDDITEKKQAEERIQHLAHFDQLTGLPNRMLLQDHFKYALSLAQRSGEHLAVMFLDLDHFKNINDTLGHSIGDQLLMAVSQRIKAALREEDTVSRLGGDEFIFILPGTDANGAAHVAEKLNQAISQPYQIEQLELISTPSIGIAIYPDDGMDMETLSKNADAAMYQVKQSGRNNFRFFAQEMQLNSARNLQLSNALRNVLVRDQLQLHYQPQISMQDGRIIGVEALLRWHHPELGPISPAEFIPIAEDGGQIIAIGEWVLRSAVTQMQTWIRKGLPPMVVAVNLSAVQFRHANLTEMVSGILDEVDLPANYLELELTEAVAMDDPPAAIAVMDKLHQRGIHMSIDDFGTGYSSLSYLKRFKVHKLKIDQSFVHDITDNPEDKAIVTSIINMASGLGLHTIAEGVETAAQLAFLRLHGCEEVQGYYFSKPLPADELENFVRKWSNSI
ncbi:MAG: EAL domain-containing protein [Sideroxydans sp.]|nr:EAL domain-containing protein [Sideroxydans sp.]